MNLLKTTLTLLLLATLGACATAPTQKTAGLPADLPSIAKPQSAPATTSSDTAPANSQEADQDDSTNTAQPIAGTITLSADSTSLWDRIRAGFGMSDMDSPLVQQNEQWYEDRPDYVRRMVDRSKLYLYYIVEEVEKRGMPTEIALLPMVESAFNPNAYSVSHASGLWQFIPSTAEHYGLKLDWWYDGRRDVVAATRAALDYLQNLYNMFGDWKLALAAYNLGEGAVSRAIARNKAKGEPTDYEDLSLPDETRNYVPRLMAIKHIIMTPGAFGLTLQDVPNRPYFTKVAVDQKMDAKVAARLANMPTDDFLALNPAYNRPVIIPSGKRPLLLPVDKAQAFASNLDSYDKPLVSWETYRVPKRERLDKIARQFRISLARLRDVNDLSHRHRVAHAGQTLLVPARERGARSTLVAENTPRAGREAPRETDDGGQERVHTVQRGDTLYSIARRNGITPADLKAWNGLKSNHIVLGQRLVLRTATPTRSAVAKASSAKKARVRVYVVRRGDTLHSIARRFNVAVNDLQRWNNLSPRHTLRPGEEVTVYI